MGVVFQDTVLLLLDILWDPTHKKYFYISILYNIQKFETTLHVITTSLGTQKWINLRLPRHTVSVISHQLLIGCCLVHMGANSCLQHASALFFDICPLISVESLIFYVMVWAWEIFNLRCSAGSLHVKLSTLCHTVNAMFCSDPPLPFHLHTISAPFLCPLSKNLHGGITDPPACCCSGCATAEAVTGVWRTVYPLMSWHFLQTWLIWVVVHLEWWIGGLTQPFSWPGSLPSHILTLTLLLYQHVPLDLRRDCKSLFLPAFHCLQLAISEPSASLAFPVEGSP